jgi:hypothetical protein
MKGAIAVVGCALACSCLGMEPPTGDIVPPSVMEFRPQGNRVQLDAQISVLFSEPVDPNTGVDGLVMVAMAELVDREFLVDLDRPPLSSRRAQIPLACTIETDAGGSRVILQPVDPLQPSREYLVVVSAAVCDLVGNPLVVDLRFDERGRAQGRYTHVLHEFTTVAAPPDPDPDPDPDPVSGLLFTEILANPAGSESAGEYAEILNAGSDKVDLTGFRLDDTGGVDEGDMLGPCAEGRPTVLSPGEAALLVGESFVAPADLLPNTVVVCTDRSTLTPRGLKNSGGEVLVLKDVNGRELTRYGGWIDLSSREGCSATRLSLTAPDDPENWAIPDGEPCRSPGWIE